MFCNNHRENHINDYNKDLKRLHFKIQELVHEKKHIDNTLNDLREERQRIIKHIEDMGYSDIDYVTMMKNKDKKYIINLVETNILHDNNFDVTVTQDAQLQQFDLNKTYDKNHVLINHSENNDYILISIKR